MERRKTKAASFILSSDVFVHRHSASYFVWRVLPLPFHPSAKVQRVQREVVVCCEVLHLPSSSVLSVRCLKSGSKRGSTPAANPLGGMEHYLQTEKNILTNTVEQLLGFLLTVLALITYLEPLEMRIIPLYSLVFIIGRILFTIGYTISPKCRSLGMLINIHAAFFFIGYTIYLMYLRGFMYGIPTVSTNPTFGTAGKTEL